MFQEKRGRMRRRIAMAILAFSWVFVAASFGPAAADLTSVEPLEIITATGPHILRVEVAKTSKEREKGLMFRTSLPENGGMLFDFHNEQQIFMWMKNTPLSLDMIFVSRAGRVVSLAQEATPFSEQVISSGAPASAVIEVSAGTARKFSVAVGDIVRHPIFGK